MTLTIDSTHVTITDRAGVRLRERLDGRLSDAAALRCVEHAQAVIAVTIHARENGWFESTWITCCETLEKQATAIVRERC
jgi:hypothetical protein